MILKILHKIKWILNPPKLNRLISEQYLKEAHQISKLIKQTLIPEINSEVISLGENCNSSWYIKQVGLKKSSYPFDWIYCSPEIINHCIKDSFKTYLDKSLIFKTRSGNSAGHKVYHNSLFNHKNPLKNEVDYNYYKRCTERFLRILHSQKPIIFVMTIITEMEKRSGSGWAKGFNQNFKLPINQTIKDLDELKKTILDLNPNCKFLFIEQITEDEPKIEIIDAVDNEYIWLKHTSFQRNTGVFFKNKVDNEVSKILFSALKESS